MSKYQGIEAFVAAYEQGSFVGAARTLSVTKVAVSKAIAVLETQLGTPLFIRTTRSMSATEEARLFYVHARNSLEALDRGRAAIEASQTKSIGKLRVSVSWVLMPHLAANLSSWFQQNPEVRIQLVGGDQITRFARDDIDVAVRLGALRDDGIVAKTARRASWVRVASPEYLANRTPLRTSKDLQKHQIVSYMDSSGALQRFSVESEESSLPYTFAVNHGAALLDAALAHGGVVETLDFLAEPHLQSGRLKRVLRTAAVDGPPISIVYAHERRNVPRIRSFVAYSIGVFRGAPPS